MRDTVLITRPKEDAVNMEMLIKQMGYEVVSEPFLEIELYDEPLDDLEQHDAVIFTSRNGVRAFCKNTHNRFLPVWTVGDATRDLAVELGFQDVQSAAGNLTDLEEMLEDEFYDEPLLYVRGKHVSRNFLRSGVREKILYHAEVKRKIPNDVQEMIKEGAFSQVLFFSTRTAEAFVSLITENGLEQGVKETKALCLGDSMVESLSVLPWKSVEVAQEPNHNSIMALLG